MLDSDLQVLKTRQVAVKFLTAPNKHKTKTSKIRLTLKGDLVPSVMYYVLPLIYVPQNTKNDPVFSSKCHQKRGILSDLNVTE